MSNPLRIENELTSPSKTCSLWTNDGKERVGTFSEAMPVDAEGAEAVQAARSVPKNVCSIQIVKRDLSYTIFVDGVKTETVNYTEAIPDVLTVAVDSNVRMHYEKRLDMNVMTPLAITLMTEDGEMTPSACDVQLKYTLTSFGKEIPSTSRDDVHPPVSLEHFTASNINADVVFAPFPVSFPDVPTIALLDKTKIQIYEQKGLKQLLATGGQLAAKGVISLPSTISELIGANDETYKKEASQWGKVLTNFFNRVTAEQAAAQRGLNESTDAIGKVSAFLAAGASAVALVYLSGPILAGAAGAATAGAASLFSASGLMAGLFNGLAAYWSFPEKPKADVLRFSIPEFTEVLKSLAAVAGMSNKDVKELQDSRKLHRELIVWKFLSEGNSFFSTAQPELDSDNQIAAPSSSMMKSDLILGGIKAISSKNKTKGANTANGSRETTIDLSVRIVISDLEFCNKEGQLVIDLKNKADDSSMLGDIASGVLDELQELSDAVDNLSLAVDLARSKEANQETWWDHNFFVYLKKQFGSASKLEASKAIGVLRTAMLVAVQRNLYEKLQQPLSLRIPDSAVSEAKNGLLEALARRNDGVGAQKLQQFWQRELPQRLTNAKFAYESMDKAGSGVNDHVVDNVPVRIFKSVTDAIERQRRVLNRSKVAIALLRKEWESNGMQPRPRMIQLYGKLQKIPNRLDGIDVYSLMLASVQRPPGIAAQQLDGRFTEVEQKSIDLICHNAFSNNLAAVGVDGSEQGVAAMRLFGVVMCEEVVASFDIKTQKAKQIENMATSAVDRACARLLDSAEFIRVMATNDQTLGVLSAEDPFFRSTTRGMDSLLALTILNASLLKSQNNESRLTKAQAGFLTSLGAAVASIAKFMLKNPQRAFNVPFEPLQALFMPARDSVCAFQRLRRCFVEPTTASEAFMQAQAASYSAMQLITESSERDLAGKYDECKFPQPGKMRYNDDQVRLFLSQRAASLSISLPTNESIANAAPGNDLAELFTPLSLDTAYFVPFGYSNFPMSLEKSAPSAIMFGSVPVFTEYFVKSVSALNIRAQGSGAVSNAETAQILPLLVQQCEFQIPNNFVHLKSKPPSLIQQKRGTFVFFGSLMPPHTIKQSTSAVEETSGHDALLKFSKFSNQSAFVENSVSWLSWTAERMLQCLCLAAADYKSFVLNLTTPFKEVAKAAVDFTAIERETHILKRQLISAADAHKRSLYNLFAVVRAYYESNKLKFETTAPLAETPAQAQGPAPASAEASRDTVQASWSSFGIMHMELDDLETSYSTNTLGLKPKEADGEEERIKIEKEVEEFLKTMKKSQNPSFYSVAKNGIQGIQTIKKANVWRNVFEQATENVVGYLKKRYIQAAPILDENFDANLISQPAAQSTDNDEKTNTERVQNYLKYMREKESTVDPSQIANVTKKTAELYRVAKLYALNEKQQFAIPATVPQIELRQQTVKMNVAALSLATAMARESLGRLPAVSVIVLADDVAVAKATKDALAASLPEAPPPALRFVEAVAIITNSVMSV
jgi:hypothetical protein